MAHRDVTEQVKMALCEAGYPGLADYVYDAWVAGEKMGVNTTALFLSDEELDTMRRAMVLIGGPQHVKAKQAIGYVSPPDP